MILEEKLYSSFAFQEELDSDNTEVGGDETKEDDEIDEADDDLSDDDDTDSNLEE